MSRSSVLPMPALWRLCLCACVLWRQAFGLLSCNSTCQSNQITALAELYTATKGSEWYRPGQWATVPAIVSASTTTTVTTDITNICTILTDSQTGFCCDSSQTDCGITAGEVGVSALAMSGLNLQGTVPPTLLTALAPTLFSFAVSGELMLGLELVVMLQSLLPPTCISDAGNQLTGTLPDLTVLTYATDLLLAKNQFTGTVPGSLLAASEAVRIDLVSEICPLWLTKGSKHTFHECMPVGVLQGGNLLTGTIPAVFTGSALSILYLDHNKLTGSFPIFLTATLLHVLDMSSNDLSGTLPEVVSASSGDVEYGSRFLSLDASTGFSLDLLFGNNQLTGNMPSWLPSLPLTVCKHPSFACLTFVCHKPCLAAYATKLLFCITIHFCNNDGFFNAISAVLTSRRWMQATTHSAGHYLQQCLRVCGWRA